MNRICKNCNGNYTTCDKFDRMDYSWKHEACTYECYQKITKKDKVTLVNSTNSDRIIYTTTEGEVNNIEVEVNFDNFTFKTMFGDVSFDNENIHAVIFNNKDTWNKVMGVLYDTSNLDIKNNKKKV